MRTKDFSNKIKLKTIVYMRDGKSSKKIGIVIFHITGRTHWVCYFDEKNDSFRCSAPKLMADFLFEKYRECVFSEYKIQVTVSYCAA